ncbi:hypothetical protein PINS_up014556 [Pythium insidiosum]|nr:hypothetical protein PINS_up014556 [Pythium insidiosum]
MTKDPAEVQKILNEKLFKSESAPAGRGAGSKTGSDAQETIVAPSGSNDKDDKPAGSKANADKPSSADVAPTKAPVPAPTSTPKSDAISVVVAPAAVALSSVVIYTML